MDFDDLEDAEASLGPSPTELRATLAQQRLPDVIPGACRHPRPKGKGFGGGTKRLQKVLYLHGPGSNTAMAEKQVTAVFKHLRWVVDFNLLEWHFLEGQINSKLEEIHVDPAVAQIFKPYGKKCGDSYDGYMSYVYMMNESHQTETWLGPTYATPALAGEKVAGEHGYEDVLASLAEFLKENGPFDGLCGFDMGACLAFDAARLAQEGDTRFEEKFRYMMLFSGRGHRELAEMSQGRLRPKAPLQLPTFLSWSQEDDSKQYSNYEELALYIHPNYRQICVHNQGHRPPNMQKNSKECQLLDEFIEKVQADTISGQKTIELSEAAQVYEDYWLPLPREPLPPLLDGSIKVFVLEDPLGEHGPLPEEVKADRMRFPAQEFAQVCEKRLEVFRKVTALTAADFSSVLSEEVTSVGYSSELKHLAWHPEVAARDASVAYQVGAGRSRWLQAEDEIAVPWSQLMPLVDQLQESFSILPADNVVFIGLGTGAHLATALAYSLIEKRGIIPARLYTVCPPTVWPSSGAPPAGALVTTPIRYLTCPESVAGPPWRLETATYGDFKQQHFQESSSLMALIAEDLSKLKA